MSDAAWDACLANVQKAAHSHVRTAVYDDIAEIAEKRCWDWPSYSTVLRRWNAPLQIERTTLRHGGRHAVREHYQPERRSVANLQAMQVAEMDGRTLDIWARFFEYLGFAPLMPRAKDYGTRPGMASFAQIEFILTLWHEYTRGKAGETELNKWLLGSWQLFSLRFLTKATTPKVIRALKSMKARVA